MAWVDASGPRRMEMPGASSTVTRAREPLGQPTSSPAQGIPRRERWRNAYVGVRTETERRAACLSPEDQVVQSMPDASPIKWHRAHTTWFFEQFLLTPNQPGYTAFDPRFAYLFNSYYVAAGP